MGGVAGAPSSLLEQSVGGKCGTKNKNKIREKKQTNKKQEEKENLKLKKIISSYSYPLLQPSRFFLPEGKTLLDHCIKETQSLQSIPFHFVQF